MSIRTFHRLIAKIGVAAVLFTQLAVAAYACQGPAGSAHGMAAATQDNIHAGMPGCEKVDTVDPNLCLQHCQAGSQSAQSSPQLLIPPTATMPLTIVEPVQPIAGLGIVARCVLSERETSPPPLIRFGVLRI